MPTRVVVYAEGVGELAKDWSIPPAPGTILEPDQLGPAHILAQRSLDLFKRIPREAVVFEHGLRTTSARVPRGSDLHRERTVQRLFTWPSIELRPDLAILFVDEDGERQRHRRLTDAISELLASRPPSVIAVARQEFESWLITDRNCLAQTLSLEVNDRGYPEDQESGWAKEWLESLLGQSRSTPGDRFNARCAISQNCDLEALKRGSSSYDRFVKDIQGLTLA